LGLGAGDRVSGHFGTDGSPFVVTFTVGGLLADGAGKELLCKKRSTQSIKLSTCQIFLPKRLARTSKSSLAVESLLERQGCCGRVVGGGFLGS